MKKRHLVTKPTRIQDLNFDDFEDVMDARLSGRSERARIRSYRKLRRQEA